MASTKVVEMGSKTVNKIQQILKITVETKLVSEMGLFEDSIDQVFDPLKGLLAEDVRARSVGLIEDHMTDVERYRERAVKALALATTFLYHCKSDHFIVPRAKSVTEFDRASYQNHLRAPFEGMVTYLDGLVRTIDSRVNLCKKLLYGEKE